MIVAWYRWHVSLSDVLGRSTCGRSDIRTSAAAGWMCLSSPDLKASTHLYKLGPWLTFCQRQGNQFLCHLLQARNALLTEFYPKLTIDCPSNGILSFSGGYKAEEEGKTAAVLPTNSAWHLSSGRVKFWHFCSYFCPGTWIPVRYVWPSSELSAHPWRKRSRNAWRKRCKGWVHSYRQRCACLRLIIMHLAIFTT